MSKHLTATLLMPTLNEIEALGTIVSQIRKEWVDEIIVVDGGSTDGTIEFLRERGFDVHSQSGRGFGVGMRQGMQIAKGDIVVEFMADGNSLPEDIPRIIAKMGEGYDLVIASRYLGGTKSDDDDWLTALGNRLFTVVVNMFFGAHFTDVLVGTRAYRRAHALRLDCNAAGLSWPCQSSIRFARAGLKIGEISAHEPKRIGGKRKMKPFKTGWEITKLILTDFATFWPNKRVR